MVEEIELKRAADILADVPPEKSFQLKDGRSLKNLYDLQKASADMGSETFSHHTTNRNDFSNWVRDVHKDEELAKKLEEAKTQEEVQKFVRDRIEVFHKIKGVKEKSGIKEESKEKIKMPKKIKTIKPKRARIVAVEPVSIRKAEVKKRFPVKVTLKESKLGEKRLCSHSYFMKCSSVHFLLGMIAGFLIGVFVATI